MAVVTGSWIPDVILDSYSADYDVALLRSVATNFIFCTSFRAMPVLSLPCSVDDIHHYLVFFHDSTTRLRASTYGPDIFITRAAQFDHSVSI